MRKFFKEVTLIILGLILSTVTVLAANDKLVIFDWAGYEDPGFFDDYMKKYKKAPKNV